MVFASPIHLLAASLALQRPDRQQQSSASTTPTRSRRDFGLVAIGGGISIAATTSTFHPLSVSAFEGTGSSALSGYNPSTKAEKVRAYKQRVIADVRDFNRLGQALGDGQGKDSEAWINFFIPYPRREADEFGRAYAALVDLRGLPTKKKYEYEGGGALLLANSFTKPGKPPENTPAVKSWNKVFKTFDAIETAGTKGDAAKARAEWEKSKPLLEQYLADVDLPGDLSDPTYK